MLRKVYYQFKTATDFCTGFKDGGIEYISASKMELNSDAVRGKWTQ